MRDMEHEDWLEGEKALKAAAKKSTKKPALPPKKSEDKKSEDGDEDLSIRSWVID